MAPFAMICVAVTGARTIANRFVGQWREVHSHETRHLACIVGGSLRHVRVPLPARFEVSKRMEATMMARRLPPVFIALATLAVCAPVRWSARRTRQAAQKTATVPNLPVAGSPADFGKLIADETEKWATVVKFSGARPD